MTESDVRQVLLLRAVETAAQGRADAPWSPGDSVWATQEAKRELGESAEPQAFFVARARLALRRLAERDARWVADAATASPWPARLGWLLMAAALLAGIAADALGTSQRINLLAPPRLALLLWNVAVYAALLLTALRAFGLATMPSGRRGRARPGASASAWLGRAGAGIAQRLSARARAGWAASARRQFAADWAAATAPLRAHRVKALLHAAAALLALGVILAMYLQGLVFDYRAGWDSTFADASQVHTLLGAVLGPAAAVSGLTLPDAPTLAALRWSDGSAGESAARWIHLYALTLAGVVVVPRLLLAAWSSLRAQHAAQRLALPLDQPYFQDLLPRAPAQQRPVTVLPYSYQLGAAQQAGLPTALAGVLGAGAQPQLAPSLPLGAEDELPGSLPSELADSVVALFALTATPERETHGAFVRALATALPPRCKLQVLIDESGFRQQVGAARDADARLQQRRDAWLQLLRDLSLPAPRFADLSAGARA